MAGIENLEKLISVATELGEVASTFGSVDNNFDRVKVLIGLLDEAMFLVNMDLSALKQEWSDLSGDEQKKLVAHFANEFDLKNDTTEAFVESSFDAMILLAKAIERLIGIKKEYAA